MVAPVSTAALIISTTTIYGSTALLNFILEMTFFTIRMVIGIQGLMVLQVVVHQIDVQDPTQIPH